MINDNVKLLEYIKSFNKDQNPLVDLYYSQLRLSASFWALCSLKLMKQDSYIADNKETLLKVLKNCYNDQTGAFTENVNVANGTILSTCSGLQILALIEYSITQKNIRTELKWFNKEKTISWIKSLYNSKKGIFYGDKWEEEDTRFTYVAILSLYLLGERSFVLENIKNDVLNYIKEIQNPDGGFGTKKYAESHAGQIFCVLSIVLLCSDDYGKKNTDIIIKGILGEQNTSKLIFWLSNRQNTNPVKKKKEKGGLNGRPHKESDNCYSWWVVSSLKMLNKLDVLDLKQLKRFMTNCVDENSGGISSMVNTTADIYHTFFGLAGISLLGFMEEDLLLMDCVFALPCKNIKNII